MAERIILYQVFTRLFGAGKNKNIFNGDKAENGCGKLADFTSKALNSIKQLGATHIWYTGVIEHATQTDYTEYGIRKDNASVVKGKAGSPYAIKDYYDIDPDLAKNVTERMSEFENLLKRTHSSGLKCIIDFVPNHVARQYYSDAKPEGVEDLGQTDDKNAFFSANNNFYYITGQQFNAPVANGDLFDQYNEYPAKATGNDCFSSTPSVNDWYETVKLNYGIDYSNGSRHFSPTPSTWKKMLDILLFWAGKGVDGFRCDMAEMVPCEFWQWAIPQVKESFPGIIFIAEVYNPNEYRNYIFNGHFDYLYDKVGLYDTIKSVVNGNSASAITQAWQNVDDIHDRMLNFLENHDEQRIASEYFAGDAQKGKAALVVSALMRSNPFMVYFGQELGEKGMDKEGFSGIDGRTTIFDYWTVDTIRRWRNGGKFDGKLLTSEEKELQQFYSCIMNLCNNEAAFREGEFFDIMYVNYDNDNMDTNKIYSFVRRSGKEVVVVAANFSADNLSAEIKMPEALFDCYGISKQPQTLNATDLISGNKSKVNFAPDGLLSATVPAYSGIALKIKIK